MAADKSDLAANNYDPDGQTQGVFDMSGMPDVTKASAPTGVADVPRTVEEAFAFNTFPDFPLPLPARPAASWQAFSLNVTAGRDAARLGSTSNYRQRIRISANSDNVGLVLVANDPNLLDANALTSTGVLSIAPGGGLTIKALGEVWVASSAGTVNVQAIEEYLR